MVNSNVVELSHDFITLNNQVMFSAETYYNVLHFIVHQIINNKFTKEELEVLYRTISTSKLNNEDISNTFFRHFSKNKKNEDIEEI